MSGLKALTTRILNTPASPNRVAGVNTLRTILVNTPSTPNEVAAVRGVSFKIVSRRLFVTVLKLVNGVYTPMADYPVSVAQTEVGSNTQLLTGADGKAVLEFSLSDLVVTFDQASAPIGYTNPQPLTYTFRAALKNELVVTFIPDLPARRYPTAQVI
jgi:hypothetical protein